MAESLPEPAASKRSQVALGAGGAILALALLRAMAIQSPLPFFDTDPLTVYTPMGNSGSTGILAVLNASLTGLGPTWSIILDTLTLLAAGIALIAAPNIDPRARTTASLLALAGTIAIAFHAMSHGGMSLEHARIGIAWLGAIWGAIALWAVSADRRARALFAGVLVAFVLVLAAKGLIQILIEHPQTVEAFDADKQAFFASKGWSPDSTSAQAYERRLNQSEATGWFGLSNVLASFAGASLVTLAMLAAMMSTTLRKSKAALPVLILGAAALVILLLTKSKGGLGAAALAATIAFTLTRYLPARFASFKPTPKIMGFAALGTIIFTLASVVARGLLGETLGERSILFRWFYMRGAGSIIAENPIVGVGPAGFQSAYSLYKPPLSPEDVTSPHSIFFDYTATLGIFGVALAILAILAIWRIGTSLGPHPDQLSPTSPTTTNRPTMTRFRLYAVAAIAASAFFVALWFERGASMPLVLASALSLVEPVPMLAILAGLLLTLALVAGWILLAERLWAMFETIPGAFVALAAGGLAIAIHAQIEMTPIQPSSAALFWAWLALAAAPVTVASSKPITADLGNDPSPSKRPRGLFIHPLPILLGGLIAVTVLPSVASWESRLVEAASLTAPVGDARTELRILRRVNPALRGPGVAALGERVSTLAGVPIAPSLDKIAQALDTLAMVRGEQGELILDESHDFLGGAHPPTMRAQTRLLRHLAQSSEDPEDTRAFLARALHRAEHLTAEQPNMPGSWSLLGLVHSELAGFSDQDAQLVLARQAWETEMMLDPHSLGTAVRLMDVCEQLSDRPLAAQWARRALEISANMRLDPLKPLGGAAKARVERIARNP